MLPRETATTYTGSAGTPVNILPQTDEFPEGAKFLNDTLTKTLSDSCG